MIDLRKYFLLLSDIVPNKTTFTNVDIAFALKPPPNQHTHQNDSPCFIYYTTRFVFSCNLKNCYV